MWVGGGREGETEIRFDLITQTLKMGRKQNKVTKNTTIIKHRSIKTLNSDCTHSGPSLCPSPTVSKPVACQSSAARRQKAKLCPSVYQSHSVPVPCVTCPYMYHKSKPETMIQHAECPLGTRTQSLECVLGHNGTWTQGNWNTA